MDRQLVRRIHEFVSAGDVDTSSAEGAVEDLCQLLQACYPEYRRRKARPFRKMVQEILDAYNEASVSEKRPVQEDSRRVTDRRDQKRSRNNVPLREHHPDELTEEFACECEFKQSVAETTADYFSTTVYEPRKICRSVLLISGPSGSGKTCLAKWLCRQHSVPIVCVDPILDLEEHYLSLLKMLDRRSVILVEDIDDSSLSSGSGKPCRLFKRLVEALREKQQRQQPEEHAILICTCRDAGSIKDSIRTLVDGEIKIPAPNRTCREAILRCLLSCSHDWLSDVAEVTPSFLPVHLFKLCSLALQKCGQRVGTPSGAALQLTDFLDVLRCESTVNNVGNLLTSQSSNAVQVPEVTWKDIGALDDVRDILHETLLTQCRCALNGRLNRLGVLSEPSGVLLVGPPGCGKTLLAKAVANELSVNFLAVNGPELLNMYVGESERSVRQLFRQASDFKPCIIFFDEIDALCARRQEGGRPIDGPLVLNQLLVEMDGIRGRRGVYLMAATNVLDAIDPAMTRPGRFGTLVYVGLPGRQGRLDILNKMVKDCNGMSQAALSDVAAKTNGYTGADLKNLVCTAARHALATRPDSEELLEEDLRVGLARTKPSLTAEQIRRYDESQRPRCCNAK